MFSNLQGNNFEYDGVYIYIYVCMYVCMYVCIKIEREEREREESQGLMKTHQKPEKGGSDRWRVGSAKLGPMFCENLSKTSFVRQL